MILIDSRTGSKELIPYLQRMSMNVKVEQTTLSSGMPALRGMGHRVRLWWGLSAKVLVTF